MLHTQAETMKKTSELPPAVNNLRAIWDKKKVEMQFTQVEAAKTLGWSQGAISHYLNNLTELGPAAVVKFANFLSVDPLDIDPDVTPFLPHTKTVHATVSSSNLNKKIDEKLYHIESTAQLTVRLEPDTLMFGPNAKKGVLFARSGEQGVIKVCAEKEAPTSSWWLIQKKKEKAGHIYHYSVIPPKSQISKIYAANSLAWIAPNRK
tara:strand:+ start:485 stop:1102 length:618 start_codon:yes stop_codon:yes gene_type:complete